MVGSASIDPSRRGDGLRVEVRRPMHRANPASQLRSRWRRRADRRRATRAARTSDDDRVPWWEALDVPPIDDLDPLTIVLLALLAAVALGLLVFFAGPFVWILVLFVVDLIVWFLLAAAGAVAWLVLGRPWQVTVTDNDGDVAASAPVRGRGRAHEHAAVVRSRLAAGADPLAAVTMHGIAPVDR